MNNLKDQIIIRHIIWSFFLILYCSSGWSQLTPSQFDSLHSHLSPWIKSKTYNYLEDSLQHWIKESNLNIDSCHYQPLLAYKLGFFYSKRNDNISALDMYKNHALPLWEQCNNCSDFNCAKTLYNIGNQHNKLGESQLSAKYYDRAINVIKDLPRVDTSNYIKILKNIARHNYSIGNLSKSNFYYAKIIQLYTSAGEEESIGVAGILNDWAQALSTQGEYSNSKRKFDQAFAIYQTYAKEDVSNELALLHYYKSHYYLDIGDYKKAQFFLDKATQLGFDNKELLYDTQAILYKRTKKYDKALPIQNKSMELALQSKDVLYISAGYENLAEIYHQSNDLDNAIASYDNAIKVILAQEDSVTIESIQNKKVIANKVYLIRQLFLKSQAMMDKEQQDANIRSESEALQYFQLTDSLLMDLLNSVEAYGSTYVLLDKYNIHYGQAIDHLLLIYEHTKNKALLQRAYAYASRYKALVLKQKESERSAEDTYLESDDQNSLKNLRREYFMTKSKYNQQNSNTDSLNNLIAEQMFSVQEKYSKFISDLEKTNTNFAKAKSIGNNLGIKDIQKKIDNKTAVLEYFYTDSILYSFIITQAELTVLQHKLSPTFASDILTFRSSIEQNTNNAKSSATIFNIVFEKQSKYLLDQGVSKISIIPDNLLWKIPFEVFTLDDKYVLEYFSMTYGFSTNHTLTEHKHTHYTKKQLLALGTSYGKEDIQKLNEYISQSTLSDQSAELSPLSFVRQELDDLDAIWSTDVLAEDEATLSNFEEVCSNYNIIHLSLHGTLNEDQNESLLFFDPSLDSKFTLTSEELYGIDLNAELAVLSACQTGIGKINKGEGMKSMARSFAHAGCSSLVASAWNSAENTALSILTDFYKELKNGNSKDVSLRNAKLNYLKNAPPSQRHPAYWANLVLLGNPQALTPSTPSYTLGTYLLIGFVFLVLLGFVFKKKEHPISSIS